MDVVNHQAQFTVYNGIQIHPSSSALPAAIPTAERGGSGMKCGSGGGSIGCNLSFSETQTYNVNSFT
jgi:hypothetical protein